MSDDATKNAEKTNKRPWLEPYRVKPGQVLNPKGRTKGARSKLGEQFVQALQADFEEHGTAVIAKVREERPQDYLKVLASILPKELNVNTTALGEMSDDELTATLISLRDLASTLDVEIARAGASKEESPQPTGDIRPVH